MRKFSQMGLIFSYQLKKDILEFFNPKNYFEMVGGWDTTGRLGKRFLFKLLKSDIKS